MNRWGHFLRGVFWFDAYWAAFSCLLAVFTYAFWVRGLETGFKQRAALARARMTRPLRTFTAVAAIVFVGLGGYIYYNTNVLNHYQTSHDAERDRADYEKTYKSLEKAPQPKITDVDVAVDIFPEQPRLVARGTYRITNKTAAPIDSVYVTLGDDATVRALTIDGKPAVKQDARFHIYTFAVALAPGAQTALAFDLGFGPRGFKNEGQPTAVVGNGTFFSSGELPSIGYQRGAELSDDGERKKYGLAPKERMADVNDAQARMRNEINDDADWITFAATVSTSPDQIAVAPGYLVREWLENGRRRYEYAMDAPILNFYSVLSARYAVLRDRWSDVALEIFYHPEHTHDLDAMMKGMKAALAYYTKAFGPYQHRQVRILEFPRYAGFAQSFPNTIPFSESIGFIARVDPKDPEDIDYPFYVTAHEVAHQWWGHQVVPGDVQGSSMLVETMAQYSALMVMKHEYGPEKMRRFLAPLRARSLSFRSHVRAQKRAAARARRRSAVHPLPQGQHRSLRALQDYIGEDNLNRALAAFVARVKFQQPPYTNTTELHRRVPQGDAARPAVPHRRSIRAHHALRQPRAGGDREEGRRRISGHGEGEREEAAGRRARRRAGGADGRLHRHRRARRKRLQGRALPREKRRVRSGTSEIRTFTSPFSLPAKAGIDPVNELIDRKPDDNVIRVQVR